MSIAEVYLGNRSQRTECRKRGLYRGALSGAIPCIMPKKRTTKKKENDDEAEGEGKPPTKRSKKNQATSVKANQDNPESSRPRHKLRDGNEKYQAPSVDPPVRRSPRRKATGRKARGRKAHNKVDAKDDVKDVEDDAEDDAHKARGRKAHNKK